MKKAFYILAVILIALVSTSLSCTQVTNLFATATPTATNTPTKTATPSPTSTATRTSTPTATPTHTLTPTLLPHTQFEDLEDGSTVLIDNEFGYQIVLPPKWAPLDLSSGDVEKALETGADAFPDMEEFFKEAVKNLDAEFIRFTAVLIDTEYIKGEFFPNMNVALDKNIKIKVEDYLALLEEYLPRVVPSLEIIGTEIVTNNNDVEIGILESKLTLEGRIMVQQQMIFRSSTALLVVTITATADQVEKLAGQYEAILQSIELLP